MGAWCEIKNVFGGIKNILTHLEVLKLVFILGCKLSFITILNKSLGYGS